MTKKAEIHLLDNYVSDFSLEVFDKIQTDTKIDIDMQVGFALVDVDMEKKIGQIELNYEVNLIGESENLGEIKLSMDALFGTTNKLSTDKFEELLKYSGALTLSHLCRAYINSATALAGMPPVMIPLVDFEDFFTKAKLK